MDNIPLIRETNGLKLNHRWSQCSLMRSALFWAVGQMDIVPVSRIWRRSEWATWPSRTSGKENILHKSRRTKDGCRGIDSAPVDESTGEETLNRLCYAGHWLHILPLSHLPSSSVPRRHRLTEIELNSGSCRRNKMLIHPHAFRK